ncbi:MAG: EscU/YscU/HrcU family type III secretion system export apparatus switch protein, partial [Candidatus Omnitrophica bacterium]|nr:EscU/YscU/HrcU family type III secretion system export apparatus switch protein [Candidatus Omnitrophota bacterium]
MPANDETGEKTEEATPRQRERAREEGRVASSREVGTLFVLTAATVTIYFSSTYMIGRLESLFIRIFDAMGSAELSMGGAIRILQEMLFQTILAILPVMLGLIVASLMGWILQIGIIFVSKPLQPQLSRINPIEGAKRIFSTQILAETAKSIFKFTVVGSVSYYLLKPAIPFAAATMSRDSKIILATIFE